MNQNADESFNSSDWNQMIVSIETNRITIADDSIDILDRNQLDSLDWNKDSNFQSRDPGMAKFEQNC